VNDPDRRSSSGASDDDAIFADIVAHLNDEAAEPERPRWPPPEDPATEAGTGNRTTESTQTTEQLAESAQTTGQANDSAQTTGQAAESAETAEESNESAQTTEQTNERTPGSSELPAGDQPGGDPGQWRVSQPSELPAKDEAQPLAAPQGWRVHEVDDESEEHFEPPPAAPLPVGDLQFWAIIAGMVGGPLLLLYLVFFNRDASSYWVLAAIAMSVGGFVLLVSRMPGQPEDDDDGARL